MVINNQNFHVQILPPFTQAIFLFRFDHTSLKIKRK
jgi:hypothetical protein